MRREQISLYINWLVSIIFNVVVIALLFRFFFKLFAANPGAGLVEFLYNSTDPLLAPFANVFTPYTVEAGSILEFSTLLAIVIYTLIGWLITELIDFITYTAGRTYRKIK